MAKLPPPSAGSAVEEKDQELLDDIKELAAEIEGFAEPEPEPEKAPKKKVVKASKDKALWGNVEGIEGFDQADVPVEFDQFIPDDLPIGVDTKRFGYVWVPKAQSQVTGRLAQLVRYRPDGRIIAKAVTPQNHPGISERDFSNGKVEPGGDIELWYCPKAVYLELYANGAEQQAIVKTLAGRLAAAKKEDA